MANTPQSVETGAASYRGLPQGDLLAALVYLYNSQGPNMSIPALQAASTCYRCLPMGDQLAALVYLAANQSGGGGTSALTAGNYAGSPPNFTPFDSPWLAIDTSNGQLWEYYNGGWH